MFELFNTLLFGEHSTEEQNVSIGAKTNPDSEISGIHF